MVKVHQGRLLTTPPEIDCPAHVIVTGNDFVSLPTVRPADGSIERFGVLHAAAAAVLEVCGATGVSKSPGADAVLVPVVEVDGTSPAMMLDAQLVDDHIPGFVWTDEHHTLTVRATLLAPPRAKGFLYIIDAKWGPGPDRGQLTLGLAGQWGECIQTVFSAGRVNGPRRAYRDRWTQAPVFEIRPTTALLGWAVMPSVPLDVCQVWTAPDANETARWERDGELEAAPGTPLCYRLTKDYPLRNAGAARLVFCVGVNREGDGARTTAIDLARHGADDLSRQTAAYLADCRQRLPKVEGQERSALERVANRNLLFNRFFALGRCIDTEEWCSVTSRSPLYYVSAAFWSRDAFLWSLPGLALIDPPAAREMVLSCFARHGRNAGVHSLYLDGTVLYPGFELDEACAFVIGLQSYVEQTADESLFERAEIQTGLEAAVDAILRQRHPSIWLFATFLCPSDDPARHPYLTYDNALVARSFDLLADWQRRGWLGRAISELVTNPERNSWDEMGAKVRDAIFRHLVVDGPLGPMFAWSCDLAEPNQQEIYDEPPGSLQLLTYYHLCGSEDPIYVNTVRWIHSAHNPYCYDNGRFPGVGCPHSEHPFVMGLFNDLLTGREKSAKDVLLRARLDGGLACEAYDGETGRVKTGAAFATCAGFLGYGLVRALGGVTGPP